MKVLSLRFGENFAPDCGTIIAHQEILDSFGSVWFGKFGNPVSKTLIEKLFKESDPRLLLIKSGTADRYWAHIDKAQRDTPDMKQIPEYYRHMADKVKCWFRITKIEKAPDDVMSKCFIVSSGSQLSNMSKISMNPCAFVDYKESSS